MNDVETALSRAIAQLEARAATDEKMAAEIHRLSSAQMQSAEMLRHIVTMLGSLNEAVNTQEERISQFASVQAQNSSDIAQIKKRMGLQ